MSRFTDEKLHKPFVFFVILLLLRRWWPSSGGGCSREKQQTTRSTEKLFNWFSSLSELSLGTTNTSSNNLCSLDLITFFSKIFPSFGAIKIFINNTSTLRPAFCLFKRLAKNLCSIVSADIDCSSRIITNKNRVRIETEMTEGGQSEWEELTRRRQEGNRETCQTWRGTQGSMMMMNIINRRDEDIYSCGGSWQARFPSLPVFFCRPRRYLATLAAKTRTCLAPTSKS